jgi:hypothetical protein
MPNSFKQSGFGRELGLETLRAQSSAANTVAPKTG